MELVLEKVNGQYLRNMAAYLSDETEVIKVIEVLNKNWL